MLEFRWQRRRRLVLIACATILCLEGGGGGLWWWRRRRRRRLATTFDAAIESVTTTTSHRRMIGNDVVMPPPRYIVGVGLPRTGSEAVYEFLSCQGVSTRHYCCDDDDDDDAPRTAFPCRKPTGTCGQCVMDNWKAGRHALHGCGATASLSSHDDDDDGTSTTAFLQLDVEAAEPYGWFLPQHGDTLPALAGDGSTTTIIWILTLRSSAERWADSVAHWQSVTERLLRALTVYTDEKEVSSASLQLPQAVTHEQVVASLEDSIRRVRDARRHERRKARLTEAYERHVENVRTTAARYGVPLVSVVVDDDDDDTAVTALTDALIRHGVPLKYPRDNAASSCWTWRSSDEDWKNFTFPF